MRYEEDEKCGVIKLVAENRGAAMNWFITSVGIIE